MKISGIKTFTVDSFRTNWVFVKVLTEPLGTDPRQAPLLLLLLLGTDPVRGWHRYAGPVPMDRLGGGV